MNALCRVVLAMALFLLYACSDRNMPAPPAQVASASAPIEGSETLQRLLRGAEIQAETDAQRAELRRALKDLRDKPVAELAAARYAGADGTPAQRNLIEILSAHIVPVDPVGADLDELVAGRSTSEGRALLDETIARIGQPVQ